MSALKLFALAAAGLFLALVAAEPLVLPAQSTGTRHTLSHFESHPYGASTRLQYDVVVPNHVLSVDKDDNVLDVRCNADGLEIRVRNLDRAMLSYRSGQVLVGSDKWGCTADITGSQPVAFYRKVLNPPSLSEG